MDTIIYIYRWKRPEEQKQHMYCREDYDLQDYQLSRVGMSESLLQICADNTYRQNSRRPKEPGGFFERRRKKKQREQECIRLAEFMRDIGADRPEVSFVLEEPVPYLAGREFNGYFQSVYVRHLLRYAGAEGIYHFIILGQTACVQELIYGLINNMKSLKWILPARLYRQAQQDMVDILYEEYGLAVEVRVFQEEESFARVYPTCRVPSVVLDFSETDRVPTVDVARGSIWLDMASSGEKRRRIEDRDTGIQYFSLKKEWKQPQKALNYLDTISKNGYNT